MNKLGCPNCSKAAATNGDKLRIAFLGGSIDCSSCGAQLKSGGRFVITVIGAIAGSLLLYILIYSVAKNSWLPVIASLLTVWCLVGTAIYFSGLKRVGTKRFHI